MTNKLIETLSKKLSNIDKKHKINLCKKIISYNDIIEIAGGIDSEKLDTKDLPICYYHTQITVHGEFDFFDRLRVNGYKSIIQNKNKSLGIKYIAIDAGKKKIISKYLRAANWQTIRNSQDFFFIKTSEYYQELSEGKKFYDKFIALKDKIDTSLFNGGVYLRIYKSPFYGYFLALELYINTIPQENVNKVIENITGLTVADMDTANAVKEKQAAEAQAARDKVYQAELQEKHQKMIKLKEDIFSQNKVVINPVNGVFYKLCFDYEGNAEYKKIEFKTQGNRLMARQSFTFKTLAEAKNYQFIGNFKEFKRKEGQFKYITLEV